MSTTDSNGFCRKALNRIQLAFICVSSFRRLLYFCIRLMLYFRFRENANNCGTQAAAAARANANLKKNHNKFFLFVTFCHRHSSEYCVVSHFSSSPCLHCISFTFYAQIPCMDTHFILLVFDKWHTHLNAHILTSNLILHFHPIVVVVRVFIILFIHSFLCVCVCVCDNFPMT